MQYVWLPRYDNETSSVAAELLASAGSSSAGKCHCVTQSTCVALARETREPDLCRIKWGVVTYSLQGPMVIRKRKSYLNFVIYSNRKSFHILFIFKYPMSLFLQLTSRRVTQKPHALRHQTVWSDYIFAKLKMGIFGNPQRKKPLVTQA
jgi:hypothetical protein